MLLPAFPAGVLYLQRHGALVRDWSVGAVHRTRSNTPRPAHCWQAELVPVASFLIEMLTQRDDKIAQGNSALGQCHANRPRLREAGETLGDV